MHISFGIVREFVRSIRVASTLRDNHSALAEIEILTKRQDVTITRLEQELELWAKPKRETR